MASSFSASSLDTVPYEVKTEIVSSLNSASELLSLALTCRSLYWPSIEGLYKTILIEGGHGERLARMVLTFLTRSRAVRHVSLQPTATGSFPMSTASMRELVQLAIGCMGPSQTAMREVQGYARRGDACAVVALVLCVLAQTRTLRIMDGRWTPDGNTTAPFWNTAIPELGRLTNVTVDMTHLSIAWTAVLFKHHTVRNIRLVDCRSHPVDHRVPASFAGCHSRVKVLTLQDTGPVQATTLGYVLRTCESLESFVLNYPDIRTTPSTLSTRYLDYDELLDALSVAGASLVTLVVDAQISSRENFPISMESFTRLRHLWVATGALAKKYESYEGLFDRLPDTLITLNVAHIELRGLNEILKPHGTLGKFEAELERNDDLFPYLTHINLRLMLRDETMMHTWSFRLDRSRRVWFILELP